MNVYLFATAFLGVFALLNLYIYRRLIKQLHLGAATASLFKAFLIFNYIGIVGYMVVRYFTDVPNWLYFLLSLPIGVIFLLFCSALLYDLLRIVLLRIPLSQARRSFLKRSLDLGAVAGSSALSVAAVLEARELVVEKVEIHMPKLKRAYGCVQLSDIHIGGLIDSGFIASMVKRVNDLKPDFIVITGDIIDTDVSRVQKALDELAKLRSRFGTFAVVGNHEYFHGIDTIIAALEGIGIRVLQNEHLTIGDEGSKINLVGVYDIFGYRVLHHMPEFKDALNGLDNAHPTILLAHQPKYIEEVTHSVDLMLSGHTHGAQLYPFRFLVKLQQPYVSGLHRHNEKLWIYVSRGSGFWGPPMRLGSMSEITHITLLPC